MIDCGFGIRECERRLQRLGLDPAGISGILVTHEHGDHIGGVERVAPQAWHSGMETYGTFWSPPALGVSGTYKEALDMHGALDRSR